MGMHNQNRTAPVVPSNAPVVVVATENTEFLSLAETALAQAGLLALPSHHIHFDAALANFKHLDLNDIALVILQASSLARIDFVPWRKAFPPEGSTLLMAISTAQQDEEGVQAFEHADDVIILSPVMDATLTIMQIRQRVGVMMRLMQRFQVVPSGFPEAEPISSGDAEYYRMREHLFPGYRFSFARDKNGEYQREWGDETMLYRLTGYTLQEMEAKGGFTQILHPDDAKIDLEHRRRTRNGEAVISEMRVIHAQGHIVWVRLMNESFKDKTSGQVVRIHGFLQDITEQKRIEQLELEQRRMIEVLQNTAIMLSSSLDVETILDRILVNLELVIPYDLADVMIIDNGIARIARYRNYEQHGLEHVIDLLAYDVTKVETLRTMFETHKPFYIPDVREYGGWAKDPPAVSPIISFLGAPVIVQDQIVAFLNIYGITRDKFTAAQTNQMQVLASQVSVAINNAQLYDTVTRHSEELERHIGDLLMVYEAGHALASTLEVGEIYQMMYREVAQRMFNSQEMRIILYDYRSNLIRVVYEVIDGQPVVTLPQPPLPLPPGPVETAIRTHHSHIVDLMIYEPLISRDHVVGVMEIRQGEPDSFDEVNVTLLSTVAAQAAVALDNAYLYAEVQSYATELEERVQERTAKLQKALRKSQEVSELRSRFLSNVQHEFRTPLTLILSASELLEKHGGRMTQEGRDSRHNTIREAVKEMVRLLDSSMIINQMDDGMLPMLPQATDVAVLTEACVHDFLRALPQTANAGDRGNGAGVSTSAPPSTTTAVVEEKAVIKVERDGDCGVAFIDPDLWRRIMMELLSNAVRYSPATQDSPIIVSLYCDDNHLRLTVTDSGIGIPESDLPHIFEMFQRGINVQNLPGSGLGLPMVKRITDLNGGNIVITSTMGKGTQATVTLPRYASKGDEHDYKQD